MVYHIAMPNNVNTTLTWKRDGRGRQVSSDGEYSVQVDGWERRQHYDGDIVGGEWAAVRTDGDETIDWFPTMREAKVACERDSVRRAR